jgi:hypothetical protein
MSIVLSKRSSSVAVKGRGSEQRSEPRYSCPRLARVYADKTPRSLARLSIVHNISANGIGLLLTQSPATGTLLNVELPGRAIINRVAQVVHSTRTQGGWLVGCTLDSPLSELEIEVLHA